MGSASKHCGVTVFEEAPSFPTENLGPVRARCDLDVSDEDCLGTLKEQVCRLGGDVVWGVASQPTIEEERKVFRGRAVKRR
jgi:hypothetical protein